MAITVVCPGCKARFEVNEKFAGKEGPCPKCKVTITIPKVTAEVKIHTPIHSEAGAKDKKGRLVLKPVSHKDTRFSPVMFAAAAGAVVVLFLLAFVFRGAGEPSKAILAAVGLLVVSPALVVAGYSFLRNDELEPYRGRQLAMRAAICGVIYAALWGIYAFVPADWKSDNWWLFITPPFVLLGALAALACMDFDYGTGFVHYGFYLLVTILLSLTMGIAPWTAPKTSAPEGSNFAEAGRERRDTAPPPPKELPSEMAKMPKPPDPGTTDPSQPPIPTNGPLPIGVPMRTELPPQPVEPPPPGVK